MFRKLDRITAWQASLVITLIGFMTFFIGLKNQFLGDDASQIVNNLPVHSIRNIKLFFEGGTYYSSQSPGHLSGVYYRPLMTTFYSLIYTLFGPHPFYYHLLQLIVCIGSAIILYLFLRYSFKPAIALFLALVFLVHPLNSQVVYEISTLQDALFFFFGIIALWLLVRSRSFKVLPLVVLCLFLSLLSKETGVLFIVMSCLYLFWWDRKRLAAFTAMIALPVTGYILLRIHAVGLLANPNNGPINNLSLGGRLLTSPSIFLFYISKFLFPWKLAYDYFWVFPHFSFVNVLLPLLADLVVIAFLVVLTIALRRKAAKAMYYSYLFFLAWFLLGILTLLQVIPLDATATESWFYFPMAGLLGLLGVAYETFRADWHIDANIIILIGCIILIALGVRSIVRGPDWSSPYNLAKNEISVSPDDYTAAYELAVYNQEQGDFNSSANYAALSAKLYPNATNNFLLGTDLFTLNDYGGAYAAWTDALKYQRNSPVVYDDLSVLSAYYGNPKTNQAFLLKAVNLFPKQPQPWFGLAVLYYRNNQIASAKAAISAAYKYGPTNQQIELIYQKIMNNQPL